MGASKQPFQVLHFRFELAESNGQKKPPRPEEEAKVSTKRTDFQYQGIHPEIFYNDLWDRIGV
jgi:hypothetical protein